MLALQKSSPVWEDKTISDPITNEPYNALLQTLVTPAMRDAFKAEAQRLGRTPSNLLRFMITDMLEEVAQRAKT